jgi:2-succinyl-5-enolpyruvyl-6-hydroxy-3-cyclohexene-1-carboxylate synthase
MAQHDLPEHRSLFVTPHDGDLGALTRAAGAGHVLVERASDLGPALSSAMDGGGLQVVEVAVDPDASLARRDALRKAIAAAIT